MQINQKWTKVQDMFFLIQIIRLFFTAGTAPQKQGLFQELISPLQEPGSKYFFQSLKKSLLGGKYFSMQL